MIDITYDDVDDSDDMEAAGFADIIAAISAATPTITDPYRRLTVPELLASSDKKLRQLGHILRYYGKY